MRDVCQFARDGTLEHFVTLGGTVATPEDLIEDAGNCARAFAHDYRWLSGHNHDYVCATTCVNKNENSFRGGQAQSGKSEQSSAMPFLVPPRRCD